MFALEVVDQGVQGFQGIGGRTVDFEVAQEAYANVAGVVVVLPIAAGVGSLVTHGTTLKNTASGIDQEVVTHIAPAV